MFERIQEEIDSGGDRITTTIQVMLHNAKAIARLNDVEGQLQMTLGVHSSSSKSVYAASEKSFCQQMPILAGTIGVDQANLDAYPKPVELNGVAPAIL